MLNRKNLQAANIDPVDDDVTDLEMFDRVGASACPDEAVSKIKKASEGTCKKSGGYGALSKYAELIMRGKSQK